MIDWSIAGLTLQVTLTAILISTVTGVPIGLWLALSRFRGRQLLSIFIYAGMGLPPVLVGLLVYLAFSRSGLLGFAGWLFTAQAMIAAQVIISLPFVIGLTRVSVEGVDRALREQLWSLGASRSQIARGLLWEARAGVILSILAGFGRAISEVGAVMLVGGNIEGHTRVLTTAIVVETRRGAFDQALGLGAILLGISVLVTAMTLIFAQRTAHLTT